MQQRRRGGVPVPRQAPLAEVIASNPNQVGAASPLEMLTLAAFRWVVERRRPSARTLQIAETISRNFTGNPDNIHAHVVMFRPQPGGIESPDKHLRLLLATFRNYDPGDAGSTGNPCAMTFFVGLNLHRSPASRIVSVFPGEREDRLKPLVPHSAYNALDALFGDAPIEHLAVHIVGSKKGIPLAELIGEAVLDDTSPPFDYAQGIQQRPMGYDWRQVVSDLTEIALRTDMSEGAALHRVDITDGTVFEY